MCIESKTNILLAYKTYEGSNSFKQIGGNNKKSSLPMSEFMETYLNNRQFDENLEMEKERKLGQYFQV